MYFVNLRVDDVELLHPQHPRHCLRLDCSQVRVVYGELPAVKESPEGVGDQLEEVEKVQLEMFHCLQTVEGVLTNDMAEIRSFLSDYTVTGRPTSTFIHRRNNKILTLTVWRCLTLEDTNRNLTFFKPAKAKESMVLMGLSLMTNMAMFSEPAKA